MFSRKLSVNLYYFNVFITYNRTHCRHYIFFFLLLPRINICLIQFSVQLKVNERCQCILQALLLSWIPMSSLLWFLCIYILTATTIKQYKIKWYAIVLLTEEQLTEYTQCVNNFASKTNLQKIQWNVYIYWIEDDDDDDDDDIQIFTARKQNISLNANEIVAGICLYEKRKMSKFFFCCSMPHCTLHTQYYIFVSRREKDWIDWPFIDFPLIYAWHTITL